MMIMEDPIANILIDSPRSRVSAAELQNRRCFSNEK